MSWEIREGDCLDVLRELDVGSVQTCVTSPPYWGLRDYGTATWEGGDPECDHVERMARGDAGRVSTDDRPGNINPAPVDTPIQHRGLCPKCGAKRIDSQLGLEPTPEQYVENLVTVFREVRRVLRDDGTVWLNLGDSYSGGGGFAPDAPTNQRRRAEGTGTDGAFRFSQRVQDRQGTGKPKNLETGLKPKDLVGIPWRVAFALQADGWWLRSDIVWSKPNPMPESVTDRPTRAHEYIFLLSKSARYFYDADAVREAVNVQYLMARTGGKAFDRAWPDEMGGKGSDGSGRTGNSNHCGTNPAGRNRRSVWTIATQPYSEAHFATFPPKLIEPCILAGSAPESTVLDPFAGAGTTGLVATQHGRDFIGIELNPEYAEMARARIRRWEANPAGALEGDPEPIEGQLGFL